MITIQHIMCSKLYWTKFGDDNPLIEQIIAYSILPDVIRTYTNNRVCSHFEFNRERSDYSWIKFPDKVEVKNYTHEIINQCEKHIVDNIQPCAMGELICLDSFYKHNSHLRYSPVFAGIEMHLIEDIVWDDFIRDKIDCQLMYDDIYVYKDKQLNGKQIRKGIEEISQIGTYVLAEQLYLTSGIVANNDWIQSYIKELLGKYYPPDLVEKTLSYMKIYPSIDKLISDKDFDKFDCFPIAKTELLNMYAAVDKKLKEINNF